MLEFDVLIPDVLELDGLVGQLSGVLLILLPHVIEIVDELGILLGLLVDFLLTTKNDFLGTLIHLLDRFLEVLDLSSHILYASRVMLDLFNFLVEYVLLVEILHHVLPELLVLELDGVMDNHNDFLETVLTGYREFPLGFQIFGEDIVLVLQFLHLIVLDLGGFQHGFELTLQLEELLLQLLDLCLLGLE